MVRTPGLIVLAMALIAARKPALPTGELRLAMADPVIEAEVAGVKLRLRVGLEAKDLIEINPAVMARLPIRFEQGFDAAIGRETLKGVMAPAEVRIAGRRMIVSVASHGRDCCAGVDGEIGLGLLPFAQVRFLGTGGASGRMDFAVETSEERGLELPFPERRVSAQLTLNRADSVATAAAGAIIAKVQDGVPEGEGVEVRAAFGVTRPARTVRFGRPFDLAGFRFDRLAVRMADFGGREAFPMPAAEAGDIVVSRRVKMQTAWPVVSIGRDRLDRCAEILFDRIARRITLRCDFDAH